MTALIAIHLFILLDQGAAWTQEVSQHVRQHRAADILLLTQSPAQYRSEPETTTKHVETPYDWAFFLEMLGVSSRSVARTAERPYTERPVRQTPEDVVDPRLLALYIFTLLGAGAGRAGDGTGDANGLFFY